ncbi:MAG: hypothetical protein HY834_19690 [Devosia nanyangense]|uniref:Uncharacterized protein n=1 Tax=Devosia nanyangense TaxID=1228055 RepID=A0A933P0T5_9HYPH|nr:hypothetical protein [Devosia nanyangense]
MRLAHLAVVSTSVLGLATPAFAADSSLALVAKLLGGFVDGGEAIQGSLGKGRVKLTAEGVFEVTFDKGVATFLYDEPGTCVFTQHVQMADEPSSDARLDFTKITGIEVRDQGEWEGLHAALITFSGPPEVLQVMMGDTLVPQQPAFAFIASSTTVDEFNAAATELQRIC